MAASAVANIAELTSRAQRAEEDDFVFPVVIALNEVSLPAASLGIGLAAALDTDELDVWHGQDHAASRRGRKVAETDTAGPVWRKPGQDDQPSRRCGRFNLAQRASRRPTARQWSPEDWG